MSSKEWFEDKSKMYYENYLDHKCTRKVRGITLNQEGQILLLHSKKRKGYSIPGGTIEEGESIKDAVIREVFEESGAEIVPIKIVGKYYHTSQNFNYDGKTFDSDRVEYFYFCKFKSFKSDTIGLDGEFDRDDMQVEFLDYEDVVKSRLFKRDKSMIERAVNEFLLYKLDETISKSESKKSENKPIFEHRKASTNKSNFAKKSNKMQK